MRSMKIREGAVRPKQSQAIAQRLLASIMTAVLALPSGPVHAAPSGGTVILPLANVTTSCINVTKETVDFWILSARIPKDEDWLTTTHGVGVRADVTLSGGATPVSFPAAASISTQDLPGDTVRASLTLHVLADEDLWNPSASAAPVKTTNFSVPITFVRDQGSSDTVKVMNALINFTNTAGQAIPANPYVAGAEKVGQLAQSVLSAFQPDPGEQVVPNFSLNFGLGRVDSGCQPTELKQGAGAEIADANSPNPANGLIKSSDVSQYCFYATGQDQDPDIGFVQKSGRCSTSVPAHYTTLNNPQFIWLAYGNCKDNTTCPPPYRVNSPAVAQAARSLNSAQFHAALQERFGVARTNMLSTQIRTQNARNFGPSSTATFVVGAVALCKSVGITAERCMSKKFARPH